MVGLKASRHVIRQHWDRVALQITEPGMPFNDPGTWEVCKDMFSHCLVMVLGHIRCA